MPAPEGLCFEKTLGRGDRRASDFGSGGSCHRRKDGEFWLLPRVQFYHVLSICDSSGTVLSTDGPKSKGTHSKPGQNHPSKAKGKPEANT